MEHKSEPTRPVWGVAPAAFRSRFKRDPAVIAAAPGRVNLLGDHTDYNEGYALPMALNLHTTIAAAPNGRASTRIYSIDVKQWAECSVRDESATGFARYVVAVASECAALGWEVPEVDMLVRGMVPIGAGLASSAALVVATATMFESLAGETLPALEKAELCQRAEHACGTPCGIMDMFVATHARPGCAMLLDCRSLTAEHVRMPPADEMVLFVVNTGVRHELAEGAYADRRASCASAARKLGIRALRDATDVALTSQAGSLTPVELRRVRHVVSENARTLHAAEALRGGDLAKLGQLMFESHDSLARDFDVSCAELNAVVELVRANRPHLGFGARMTGAGFGGCAIVLCSATHAAEVRAVLGRLLKRQFGWQTRGFTIVRALSGQAAGCQVGRSEGDS